MLLWYILFLPLASFAFISLFCLRRHSIAAGISVGAAILNAALAIYAILNPTEINLVTKSWLSYGDFQVRFGMTWDELSQLMLLIVTFVGALIHIYSLGYMRDDSSKARYFGYLSLFMFSMLGIVFARNFLMMFIFWELVGFSSYLLIGFWYEKASAADAGKKAFLTNKLGDFGFLLGIILLWNSTHSLDFNPSVLGGSATLIGLLLFCGAVGKSAQFPLHVWLPDAMEGPTPVSALIHAATMVAAGVYMLCRIFAILTLSSRTMEVVAWTGGITALLAALWAVGQDDIKRILAFSTLSQLGYMVMAVGLGSPSAAMFHLSTHACFKALLFMGAGSVIVALHHEQNIWKMGGLAGKLKATTITFAIGLLALCGFPYLFSGALSKDLILSIAFEKNQTLFYIAITTAVLTSFYMGRLFVVAFLGKSRSESADHAHENGLVMILPLVILSILSFRFFWTYPAIENSLHSLPGIHEGVESDALHILLMAIPFIGLGLSFVIYISARTGDPIAQKLPPIHKLLANKFYLDELYDLIVRNLQDRSSVLLRIIDRWVIDGVVKTVSLLTKIGGNFLRCFQSGNLQTYIIFLGFAVIAIVYWTIFP